MPLLKMGLIRKQPCYDQNLMIEERLDALTQSRFYHRIMGWKRFAFLRPMLPKAPASHASNAAV
jgi:hypothetical protein